LRRFAMGQGVSPAMQSSPASEQSVAIRTAASHLVRTLASERQARIIYPFPSHETPTMAKFTREGGPGGPVGHGNPGGPGAPVEPGRFGGPGNPGGPGGLGGPGGAPSRPGGFAFVGEKYGQAVWTNFPVSDVPRPGLRMGELNTVEQDAAHGLLKAVLSPMGYQKVLDIMAADQTLADEGTPYASGYDAYTLALFGQPVASSPWMLQFGGHHLGLNVTFVDDKAVCAPLHTGILPSKFVKNGKTIRGLGRENDKAFDLVATLTPDQLKAARIDHDVSDLVFGPGHPNAKLAPEGLRGSAMSEQQRTIMFSLASEWAGMLNDFHSAQRLEEIRRSLPHTRFAWSGPTTHEPDMNGESYFRLHGPSLLIEHAPQGNQGGYKLHVHTVMRDLGNDYAKQLV
jgi:Protein of unknown function (DUF3500)